MLLAEYRGTHVAVKRVMPPSGKSLTCESPSHESLPSFGDSDIETGSAAFNWKSTAKESSLNTSISKQTTERVKVKSSDLSSSKAGFLQEMRILSKLQHPCIMTVMGAVNCHNREPMLVTGEFRLRCRI